MIDTKNQEFKLLSEMYEYISSVLVCFLPSFTCDEHVTCPGWTLPSAHSTPAALCDRKWMAVIIDASKHFIFCIFESEYQDTIIQ